MTKITVFENWDSMIEGIGSEDIETVDRAATGDKLETIVKGKLNHLADEVEFIRENNQYGFKVEGFDCNNDPSEEVQQILDSVWDAQLFWVYGQKAEYSKDDFEEMIRDWRADNAPEYDDLEIGEIEFTNNKWQAQAHDNKNSYCLIDDGKGNIVINYDGTY